MITPGTPNPFPIPGTQVCIPFTSTSGGAPVAQVDHGSGGTISPTISALAHPQHTYVLCFTWPAGNTSSSVTIEVGSESVTFSVIGTGGP